MLLVSTAADKDSCVGLAAQDCLNGVILHCTALHQTKALVLGLLLEGGNVA